MFIDSHCHLDFPELSERLPEILQKMQDNQVSHALCVSVTLPEFPNVLALAEAHPNLYASAGVHPDYEDTEEPTVERLLQLAAPAHYRDWRNWPRLLSLERGSGMAA